MFSVSFFFSSNDLFLFIFFFLVILRLSKLFGPSLDFAWGFVFFVRESRSSSLGASCICLRLLNLSLSKMKFHMYLYQIQFAQLLVTEEF